MTEKENNRRREDEHVQYITANLCGIKSERPQAPFVFISYKSDDWEPVLHHVVYTLVKDYGLNVYFDGSFATHNSLWVEQFPLNMNSRYCKGVIAFLDDRYATSYATLMELLYSQTLKAGRGGKLEEKKRGLPVVPVNLDKLNQLPDDVAEEDTGLGKSFYPDKTKNANADVERKVFETAFNELKRRNVLGDTAYMYTPGDELLKDVCSSLLTAVLGYLKVNENWYTPGQSLDDIAASIEDACGKEVFSKEWRKRPQPPKPEPPKPQNGTISLPEFVKKYNFRTFLKDTYKEFRLVGEGECAKYTTEYFSSAAKLTQSFIRTVLEEQGEAYILRVLEKEKARTNPSFIPRQEMQKKSVQYQKLNVPGLENWAMCSNYGQYGWISDVLRRRIEDLGLPLESFSLEYILDWDKPVDAYEEEEAEPTNEEETGTAGEDEETGTTSGDEEAEPTSEDEETGTTGGGETGTGRGIDGTAPLGGGKGGKKKNVKARNGYSFTIFGEDHTQQSQKNVMLTVFKAVIDRHPDKLDELVERLPCLGWGSVIGDKTAGVTTTFRNGEAHTVDGREFSIGTSLNSEQAFGYIKQLLQICGEPEDRLNVYQRPE